MPYPITKRQKEVLDFIKSYIGHNGYSPTLEEMKKRLHLSAVSTVHQHINALIDKGYIKKFDNLARAIEIKGKKIQKRASLIEIPLLGVITAGYPIEAVERRGETIAISEEEIPSTGKHYALKVSGNSMIDEGIFDGDIVVIRQQQTADDGQTVVAIIDDNQATLKKIYREKNRFRLQPANQSMLPFYRTEVEIRGVVVKIVRELESVQDNDSELLKLIKKMPPTLNVKRVASSAPDEKAKPFIQWVGGKREMIPQYEKFIPKKFKNYYEPFMGGGAMFFYLQPEKAVLSDNNQELIKTYEGVRDNPEEVIRVLRELKSKHSKDLFMKIRNLDREIDIYNKLSNGEIAARMIYLNQTCFNGLYRVNQKSQFNVPIGSSLKRLICDEYTIRSASKVLKKIELKEADFETTVKDAEAEDFIYLDPPYYPVSAYSDFTRYTKEKFYQEDQVRLKEQIDRLKAKGCKVMLSNSDCDFIKNLYKDYKIHEVQSSRSLNCKKDRRGKVSELLIMSY
ncbi:MAG: transcriptional repressor LexA [Candidatus Buchananbacteria bacterium]|nr:transcriptional repressor LexA [Candidatus Buchananbacteria bacterium]